MKYSVSNEKLSQIKGPQYHPSVMFLCGGGSLGGGSHGTRAVISDNMLDTANMIYWSTKNNSSLLIISYKPKRHIFHLKGPSWWRCCCYCRKWLTPALNQRGCIFQYSFSFYTPPFWYMSKSGVKVVKQIEEMEFWGKWKWTLKKYFEIFKTENSNVCYCFWCWCYREIH